MKPYANGLPTFQNTFQIRLAYQTDGLIEQFRVLINLIILGRYIVEIE